MKAKKSKLSLILIILGIVIIIAGFISGADKTESYKTYGGDAYTGIQQAGATTANNVASLITCVSTISGLAFIAAGLYVNEKEKQQAATLAQLQALTHTVAQLNAKIPAPAAPAAPAATQPAAFANPAPAVAAPVEAATKACPVCGTACAQNLQFCSFCGAKLN